jgi:NADPH-dependent 2,4-dienoyl-CoA reductase/sulfur reductase-like enzyme
MTGDPSDVAIRDVVVVGAGAAGMSAAYAAARAGCAVTVIDANPVAGGQYHRRRVDAAAYRPRGCDDEEVWRHIHIESATTAYAVEVMGGGTQRIFGVRTRGDDRHRGDIDLVRARRLIIATGAYDRPLPVPGWDLPGVMTGGGAQALIKGSGVLPGNRVVVAGTGPFLLAVAHAILEAGGSVAAVVEANDPVALRRHRSALTNVGKAGELARFVTSLARHRVPYLRRHRITRVHGETTVEGVSLARVDASWHAEPGTERFIEADTLTLGYGFTAQTDLLAQLGCTLQVGADEGLAVTVDDDQATSVTGVFAAGESTGVGGVDLAGVEGLLAGAAMARSLGHPSPLRDESALRRSRDRMRAFADALAAAFPLRSGWHDDLEDDTVVCRCEEVPVGRIRTAITELGAHDARTVKLLTRAGMGWCQGRICSLAVDRLCPRSATLDGQARAAARPVAVPVPLAALAGIELQAGKES